jgi:hypothetical protein
MGERELEEGGREVEPLLADGVSAEAFGAGAGA